MKNLIIFIAIFSFTLNSSAQQSKIIVEMSGISSNEGYINIGLFNNEDNFLKYEKAYKTAYLKSQKQLVYTFKNIPKGNYAITVYHDINSNKKLDRNFIGFPAEDYGFSKDNSIPFGRPSFFDYDFLISGEKTIIIKIDF